jgi:hypothetical protein
VSQWIVCPRDHLRHSKVRAFIAWVRKERDEWAASCGPVARLRPAMPN